MRLVKKSLFRSLVILFSAFTIFSSPTTVFAAFRGALELNNNIIFYDKNYLNCPSGTLYNTNMINGAQVLIIGDSITNGSQSEINEQISGVQIDAQDGRQFTAGISLLDNLPTKEVTIFALGSNDNSLTKSQVDDVVSKIGSKKLIFVTNYKLGDEGYYASNNNLMRSAAQENENVAIADWAGAVASAPEQYINSADGLNVHPTTSGKALFAKTLSQSITQFQNTTASFTVGTSTTKSGDNVSTILSVLIKSGYSQIAAAAIVGNLKGESYTNIDPNVIEGGKRITDPTWRAYDNGQKTYNGGFGIAQWTSLSRVQDLQAYADSLNQPVISLDVQVNFLIKELTNQYGYSPSKLNAYDLEHGVFEIYKYYERPQYSNLVSSYEDLPRVPDAKSIYDDRLKYAQEALGIVPASATTSYGYCSYTYTPYTGSFPAYRQRDPKWANYQYGSSTIGGGGCGGTSFAMMATALLHREVLPTEIADILNAAWVNNRSLYVARGSSHDVTKLFADALGLEYSEINVSENPHAMSVQETIDKINEKLRDGWMIHSTGLGARPYSSGGHFIGIYGITAEGKWLIADSGMGNAEYDPVDVVNAGMNRGNLRAIR